MKRVARKGLVTAMVAGGVLASAGYAQADAAADGESVGSPGVLSGNTVQVPVDIPVNACGNTINVIGLLNPTMGNSCANTSATAAPSRHRDTGASSIARPARHAGSAAVEPGGPRLGGQRTGAHARTTAGNTKRVANTKSAGEGAQATGTNSNSAGVLAGNTLRLPIHLPINLSGNSVNVVGIGNPSSGNTAVNGDTPPPPTPATPPVRILPAPPAHQPIPAPPNVLDPVAAAPTLAHTGSDGLGWTAAGSAALLLGGAVLYRRFRPGRV
jgi:LPXTG-motif cell wall-anchored protein